MHRRPFIEFASILPAGLAALLLLTFAGCGEEQDGQPREAVSGTVSLDGQPLPDGMIQWIPSTAREGSVGGAAVKDGKFSIVRQEGLAPGAYRVVINSAAAGGATAPAPDEPPGLLNGPSTSKDVIPPQYNTKSTLKAEIKAGVPNLFDFSLKSK
ncbi:MAG: hypothetical protein P4L84_02055 [Isosphaeraceae bacterium]|nr:hypothetical protein [Isosphaeraceae bacterium]